jgi:hypothetical protein
MNLAPITVFAYNRPIHLKQTIEALQKNIYANESELIIFSDGFKTDVDKQKVFEVRNYIKSIKGFKQVKIIEREKNYGLANSIAVGVKETVDKFGKIIVLEDDLITSPYFLKYMNDGLNIYEKIENVISIHGYIYPLKGKLPETFFIRGADCQGWATWKRGWDLFEINGQILLNSIKEKKLSKEFNFNNSYHYTQMLERQAKGENTSWAIRWYASAFLNKKLTLYPGESLIFHNGGDGSGTNTSHSNYLDVELNDKPIDYFELKIEEDKEVVKLFELFFKSLKVSLTKRIINKLTSILRIK